MLRTIYMFIFLAILLGLIFVCPLNPLYAIDELQLYIEGATYDSTETWVIDSSDFTLWVLGDVDKKGTIYDVYLSAAYPTGETGTITFTPRMATLIDPPYPGDPSPPSFPILITYGGDDTVPKMGDGSDLPSHDIFGRGTSWYQYLLGNFSLKDSYIADMTANPLNWIDMGQINAYDVSITGFTTVHFDAFDHYLKTNPHNDAQYVKAPFSHDSEGGGGGGGGQEVPEPGTLMLLGSGLLGVAFCLRKKLNK